MRAIHFTRALSCAFLVTLASCGTIQVDLPSDFLVTHRSSYELKATTADDAIFWVQRYDTKHDATLEFWVKALKNQFVGNLGYVLLEEEAIETEAGDKGHQMVFESTAQGRPYRYLIGVLEQAGPVVCIPRFFAEKDRFDQHLEAAKRALRTTRG